MRKDILELEREVQLEPEKNQESYGNHKKGYLIAKRIFDIVLSSIGLVFCIIPIGIIALMIKIDSPGPVFFWHHRIGKNGKNIP